MDELKARIEDLLESEARGKQAEAEALEARMADLQARRVRFTVRGREIYAEFVEPRLRLLERYFDDVEVRPPGRGLLRGSARFDARGRLEGEATFWVEIRSQAECTELQVVCRMRIIPRLMDYRHGGQISFDLEAIDREALARFLDDEIVEAMKTYLRMKQEPAYRPLQQVVDPVCGMKFDAESAAATLVHEGKTFHFCAEVCRDAFAERPALYLRLRDSDRL